MGRVFECVSDWWISMLAPPGYAKMTATPSRCSASTKMSRPNIAGPTSARLAADLVFAFADSDVLLIVLSWVAGLVDEWIDGATLAGGFPIIQSSKNPIIRFHVSFVAARPRATKNPQPFPAVGSC